jgi:hypothetical protein
MMRAIGPELYRCYYVGHRGSRGRNDPCHLVDWDIIRKNERGRCDDPRDKYRVLYTADTELTAVIEVIASLRPSLKTIRKLSEIEDTDDTQDEHELISAFQKQAQKATQETLETRYTALLTTDANYPVYDVMHGASRTDIERQFGLTKLKTGFFNSMPIEEARAVSRFVFESTSAVGIYSTSAEAGDGYVTSLFEAGHNSNTLRVGTLDLTWTERTLSKDLIVGQAMEYLGITGTLSGDAGARTNDNESGSPSASR